MAHPVSRGVGGGGELRRPERNDARIRRRQVTRWNVPCRARLRTEWSRAASRRRAPWLFLSSGGSPGRHAPESIKGAEIHPREMCQGPSEIDGSGISGSLVTGPRTAWCGAAFDVNPGMLASVYRLREVNSTVGKVPWSLSDDPAYGQVAGVWAARKAKECPLRESPYTFGQLTRPRFKSRNSLPGAGRSERRPRLSAAPHSRGRAGPPPWGRRQVPRSSGDRVSPGRATR